MAATSSGRAPEAPAARVRALRSCMARTTSASTGSPMPAAWLWTTACCTRSASAGAMRVWARAPKPVVTP